MTQSTDRLTHPRLNLIEERLGRNLAAYITERRGGPAMISWRLLALELHTATNVDVSGEALRLWWIAGHEGAVPTVGAV